MLGIPWFHRHSVQLTFPDRVFQFVHKGKMHKIVAKSRGETIPIVSDKSFSKEIKSTISAYMVFIRDTMTDMSADFNVQDENNFQFLNKFKDCFSEALPDQLPPERPEDHMIDLMSGSEPPKGGDNESSSRLAVQRLNTTQLLTFLLTCTTSIEDGWFIQDVRGLSHPKQDDHQEQVPHSTH